MNIPGKNYIQSILQMMKNNKLPQKTTNETLEDKTAIITGATSGIGKATAYRLAQAGANLIIIARNQYKADTLCEEISEHYDIEAIPIIADYTILSQVTEAAEQIRTLNKHIDILINNAGIFSTKKNFTTDGFEHVFQVNHLAHLLFTLKLLPLFKQQNAGRIIYVNSEGHRFGKVNPNDFNFEKRKYTGLKSYGAAKSAQLLTIQQLSSKLEDANVTVNAMHPGAVKTAIGSNNGSLYNWYSDKIISRMLKDPSISADALYYLSSAPELENITGAFFNLTHPETPAPHARNIELSKIVWNKSLQLLGIQEP